MFFMGKLFDKFRTIKMADIFASQGFSVHFAPINRAYGEQGGPKTLGLQNWILESCK
jgi:hypothetical protein